MLLYLLNTASHNKKINYDMLQKLNNGGASSSRYGISIDVTNDANTLVIGASITAPAGAAYIFTKQNGSYVLKQAIEPTDLQRQDAFGAAVSLSGDGSILVISSPAEDNVDPQTEYMSDTGDNTGAVYIFYRQADGTYLQTQKLKDETPTTSDAFGHRVKISNDGTHLIVGARYWNTFVHRGANVFVHAGNGQFTHLQRLLPQDGLTRNYFGETVAITGNGDTIIVGANFDGTTPVQTGAAYIYRKQPSGTYTQTQKIVASDAIAMAHFGYGLDITNDGSLLAVGAYSDSPAGYKSGSVYIFKQVQNGEYTQFKKIKSSDGRNEDRFGVAVSFSEDGGLLVVGAPGNNGNGTKSGSVYCFEQQKDLSFTEVQKLKPPTSILNANFGVAVSISGNNEAIVVGASLEDYTAVDSGAAYIFK